MDTNQIKKAEMEKQAKQSEGGERDFKGHLISKFDVLKIIDNIMAQSARLLSYPTIRSAEARAMLNGVKDEVKKL